MDQILQVSNLSKYYYHEGLALHILDNINFTVNPGEFKCVLAPYGSGKSSLLKIISGLEKPTSGTIEIESEKTGYIPSKPSSFPWLNVQENIEYALKLNPSSKKSVKEYIDLTGLSGYENHYPDNRSIGFRFRISLARSLSLQPELLLIDEPFNLLDQETKIEIYQLLRSVHKKLHIAVLFATSNISEALFLSDGIILMYSQPSQILKIIENRIGMERKKDIFTSQEFLSLRKEVEDYFKVEQTQSLSSLLV